MVREMDRGRDRQTDKQTEACAIHKIAISEQGFKQA